MKLQLVTLLLVLLCSAQVLTLICYTCANDDENCKTETTCPSTSMYCKTVVDDDSTVRSCEVMCDDSDENTYCCQQDLCGP